MTLRLATAALLLTVSATASAHGGGLWVSAVTGLCLAQDPAYAKLPMGALHMQDEAMPRFIAQFTEEQRACLRKHKAASSRMCKALLSVDPQNPPTNAEYDKMGERYKTEIDALLTIGCEKKPK